MSSCPQPPTLATPSSSTTSATTGTATHRCTTPALGVELSKAEARQGKNLWVTLNAIDGLTDRIAKARKELEDDDKDEKSKGTEAILKELAKDCEGMKALDSVGSEHKNFHATISKLAKAAEKQFGGDVESVRRTPNIDEKALHTAIITHLYRNGAFRSAAKFAEESSAAIPPESSAQLVEMHGVLEALKKRNLVPAER